MLRSLFILFAVLSVVFGAVYFADLEKKPEEYADCEGCWISEIETFIPVNESIPSPTKCQLYKCLTKSYQVHTCGAVGYPKKCKVIYDSSLPYPGCCAKVVCPKTKN